MTLPEILARWGVSDADVELLAEIINLRRYVTEPDTPEPMRTRAQSLVAEYEAQLLARDFCEIGYGECSEKR